MATIAPETAAGDTADNEGDASGIYMLEVATGIRDLLVSSGFTLESLLRSGPAGIASTLGIEIYVARLIFNAAKSAAGEMPWLRGDDITATGVHIAPE